MKSLRYLIALAIVLNWSLALADVAGEKAAAPAPAAEHGDPKAPEGKEKRVVATVSPDGIQRVDILGGDYYFDPNYIVVKVNVPVELVMKKVKGYVPHNIMVKAPEAGIDFKSDMKSDTPPVIKFTPTKTGKYPMYCDKQFLFFKSHRERGMEGMIEVVE